MVYLCRSSIIWKQLPDIVTCANIAPAIIYWSAKSGWERKRGKESRQSLVGLTGLYGGENSSTGSSQVYLQHWNRQQSSHQSLTTWPCVIPPANYGIAQKCRGPHASALLVSSTPLLYASFYISILFPILYSIYVCCLFSQADCLYYISYKLQRCHHISVTQPWGLHEKQKLDNKVFKMAAFSLFSLLSSSSLTIHLAKAFASSVENLSSDNCKIEAKKTRKWTWKKRTKSTREYQFQSTTKAFSCFIWK